MNKEQLLNAACEKASEENRRMQTVLDYDQVRKCFDDAHNAIVANLTDGEAWKSEIPAKQVFAQFCKTAKIQPGRLKNRYITAAIATKSEIFQDIRNIFKTFSER